MFFTDVAADVTYCVENVVVEMVADFSFCATVIAIGVTSVFVAMTEYCSGFGANVAGSIAGIGIAVIYGIKYAIVPRCIFNFESFNYINSFNKFLQPISISL